jgi:hypothetical protein
MDGIVTDAEGLTFSSEEHFLVCNQSRQSNRMYRDFVRPGTTSTAKDFFFFERVR